MGKHKKDLDHCKTWKELEEYSEYHGLPYDHTNGGHNVHKNENGMMPFCSHGSGPDGDLLFSVRKQIKKLIAGLVCIFLVVYAFSYFI
jgi:hypothetical protein